MWGFPNLHSGLKDSKPNLPNPAALHQPLDRKLCRASKANGGDVSLRKEMRCTRGGLCLMPVRQDPCGQVGEGPSAAASPKDGGGAWVTRDPLEGRTAMLESQPSAWSGPRAAAHAACLRLDPCQRAGAPAVPGSPLQEESKGDVS